MGALHAGHMSLIKEGKKSNDLMVCSIFVNPIQFNNPADLVKYPRDLEKDKRLLEEAACDVLFAPSAEEMYPQGRTGELNIDLGRLDKVMEGAHRPGHFKGVAIVVKKLFDIAHPTNAYFGLKDYQQVAVVKHLVKALKLPVNIVACPTIREPDGLAMSSRNALLSAEERKIAPMISRVLFAANEKAATEPVIKIVSWAKKEFASEHKMQLEYFEIADAETLQPVAEIRRQAVACAAVKLGTVRLIDNVIIP